MAQTYTLDEAAAKMALSLEEFKRRLRTEWTQIRSFRDGNTLRFRANEIDELARTIGLGSSAELQLGDSDEVGAMDPEATVAAPVPKKPAPKKNDDALINLDSDEVFLLTGDDGPKSGKSAVIKSGKPKADSGVKLGDSRKKLKPGQSPPASAADDDESILSEDEFELPTGMSSSKMTGKSGKLSSIKLKSSESGAMPKPGDSGSKHKAADSGAKHKTAAPPAAPPDSSEFELSLDADSDDFELSLMPDSDEEVSLGGEPPAAGNKSGQSGINLNRPADSGVSLEGKSGRNLAGQSGKNLAGQSGKNLAGKSGKNLAPQPDSDEEIDFELSIETPGSGMSSKKSHGSSKKLQQDSDSEFELSLEEPSDLSLDLDEGDGQKGDIFEATDFEIPALEDDSASEAISLDDADTDLESSEFDLAIDDAGEAVDDESASEVVAIDEDDVQSKKKKLKKKKKKKAVAADDEGEGVDFDDMELEEGSSASQALTGVNPEADEDAEEYEVSESAEDGAVRYAAPAQWGALPAVLMLPTMLVLFLGGLMAYELLHGMWGYQQSNKPTTPLLTALADTFGMKPAAP